MGLLLHLSDLHLTPPSDADVTGDYAKMPLVPLPHRQSRTATIRNTLRALGAALAADGTALDAVVVSGDVTYQGSQDGFALLPEVLGELGSALPPPAQVLVCPGNHDVPRGSPPGSAERYEGMLTLRALGYTTAYLDGVDLTPGSGAVSVGVPDPVVAAADGSFELVALNSADMSNIRRDDEPELLPHLPGLTASADPAVQALVLAWRGRGYFDVARVQPEQLLAVERVLAVRPSGPVRFAALHHQLVPVGLVEEFRPFDGLTNLAEVRSFLAGNGVHAVLHGHKHEHRAFEDFFVPYGGSMGPALRRLLVLSAPTVGHGAPAFGSVGRLVLVDGRHPTLAPLISRLLPAVAPGSPLRLNALPPERLSAIDRTADALGVLEGPDTETVLRKLLVLGQEVTDLPRPLVCRITDGRSALTLPESYPAAPPAANPHEWFLDIARWWQAPDAGNTGRWNHGERIRSWGGGAVDQVQAAVAALAAKPASSRAIVVLTRPETDLVSDAEFPAFVSAQFLLNAGVLHVIAQFRKQEMPHWWPVNVAELALLQRDVIERLGAADVCAVAGSITTVTAMPVAGRPLPRVAVPRLDRLVDEPGGVLPLLLPLISPWPVPAAAAARALALWNDVLSDWTPTGSEPAAGGDPVPVAGFDALRTTAEQLLDVLGVEREGVHVRLLDLLGLLRDANRQYALGRGDADRRLRHDQWRQEVVPLVERLSRLIPVLLRTAADADAAVLPRLGGNAVGSSAVGGPENPG